VLAEQKPAGLAAHAARLIDRHAGGRVLVFGSLPPEGRDLDLLVRSAEERSLAHALPAEGFVGKGRHWALFRDCSAYGIELVPAAAWRLPQEELEALFEEARPIEGFESLVRPAPAHALLILARRVAAARAGLEPKLRARLDALAAEDARVWEQAEARAEAWAGGRALARLAAAREGKRSRAPRLRPSRRPKRSVIVAFSGLDGAGKSTQASVLREALDRLGVEATVVWRPLGDNRVLELIGRPAKRILSSMRFGPLRGLAERSARGSVMSVPGREGDGIVRSAWATFVVVLNLAAQRQAAARHALRGRVVIYDRHVLDSAVRMRFLYGAAGRSRLQRLLLRTASPRADFAYLLEIPPETAAARKRDWTLDELRRQADLYHEEAPLFGVRRLDGQRPREELCALVASDVWRALG
jgi:thymidylate kinase